MELTTNKKVGHVKMLQSVTNFIIYLWGWTGVEPSPLLLRPFIVPALSDSDDRGTFSGRNV
jgi:hypothetical protein